LTTHKSINFFQKKATIDKAHHDNVAYKIQVYANRKVDELVKDFNDAGISNKPLPSMLTAELSILNKPEVYKNYNRIIQSKYTSNDAINNMLVKNKAQKDLEYIVTAEMERISKNLDYVEQVMQTYEIQTSEYNKLLQEQKNKSVANRKKILEEVAYQKGEILKSEGLNIPSHVFTYKDLETTAQSLLRQSQMTAGYEEKQAINQHYINNNKSPIYTHKKWIHTHRGKTTRHSSNHMQKVRFDEPFIVVNDKTLHIDEMMYPCDPRGSFSNAWICYCECDYMIGEDDPHSDTLNYTTGTVKVSNPNLFKPVTPISPTTAKPIKFGSLSKPYVNTGTPVNRLIDVNIDGIESINHNYLIDGSKLDIILNDGKYYYNGLQLSSYNESSQIGKVSKKAVTNHNNQFKVTQPKSEFIDVNDFQYAYLKDKNAYLLDEGEGAFINANGKWEYNGLEADYSLMDNSGGYFNAESIEKHNHQVTGKQYKKVTADNILTTVEQKPLTNEVVNENAEIIDINDLHQSMFDKNKFLVDGDVDKVDYNESTGEYSYKGLVIKDYDADMDAGFIYINEITDHNQKLGDNTTYTNVEGKFVKGEPIEYDLLKLNEDGDAYTVDKYWLTKNEVSGLYELNGLPVDEYMGNDTYIISKVKVDEHNSQFGIKPKHDTNNTEVMELQDETSNKVTQPAYIDDDGMGVDSLNITTYIYGDLTPTEVKFNNTTGKYELQGLELDEYDPSTHFGKVSTAKFKEHNEKYKDIKIDKPALNNKYINAMTTIETVKENGEIYMVDKATGKKYVYDEKAEYEQAQDIEQMKVSYDTPEYDSTAHWGQYGHQILNGLIYGVKKYGYDAYTPYLKQAQPILDKLRVNSKEILNAETDAQKTLLLEREKGLMNKLGDIVDNIPRQSGCGASLKSIKNAIWEIVYMDKSIMKSPALLQDTFFVRFGHFDKSWCEVGKNVKLEGYTSTTYESNSASHFEDKMDENPNRWAILIMADEGSSGIRLNDQFDALTSEREWLLARDQEFEVVEFNEEMRTVVLRVIQNDLYN